MNEYGPMWKDELPEGEAERQEERFREAFTPGPDWDWEGINEAYRRGMLREEERAVAEATAEVDSALERGDRGAFAEWATNLRHSREALDRAGDRYVEAQLHRFGDDDDPELVEA